VFGFDGRPFGQDYVFPWDLACVPFDNDEFLAWDSFWRSLGRICNIGQNRLYEFCYLLSFDL